LERQERRIAEAGGIRGGLGSTLLLRDGRLLRRRHVVSEPLERTDDDIPAMDWVDEAVAFVGVNDKLRGNVEVAESMPELVGLRRGHSPSRSPTTTSVGVVVA